MTYIRETERYSDGGSSTKITKEGDLDFAMVSSEVITLMVRGTDNPAEARERLTGLVDEVVQELMNRTTP